MHSSDLEFVIRIFSSRIVSETLQFCNCVILIGCIDSTTHCQVFSSMSTKKIPVLQDIKPCLQSFKLILTIQPVKSTVQICVKSVPTLSNKIKLESTATSNRLPLALIYFIAFCTKGYYKTMVFKLILYKTIAPFEAPINIKSSTSSIAVKLATIGTFISFRTSFSVAQLKFH